MAATLHAGGVTPDPARLWAERRRMAEALARRLGPQLPGLIEALAEPGPFTPDARAAGRRALRIAALHLLTRIDGGRAARAAYAAANNMTEEVGALAALLDAGAGQEEVRQFEARWAKDRNVMDKWFALQIAYAHPDRAVAVTEGLTRHPDFDWKNPNRFRSVIGAMSANHAGFHHASGAGYRLVADWLLKLDPLNPQTAARMSTAFDTWPRYDADRRGMVQAELARMAAAPGLSRDLGEMVGRMRGV